MPLTRSELVVKLTRNQATIDDLCEKIENLEENGCQNRNIIIRKRAIDEKGTLESQLKEAQSERLNLRELAPGRDPVDQNRGTKRMRSSDEEVKEVKAGFCGQPDCRQVQVLSARNKAQADANESRRRVEANGMTCAYRLDDCKYGSKEHSCQDCFCTEVWQGTGNTGQPDENFKDLVHEVLTRLPQSNFNQRPWLNPNNVTYDSGDAFTPPQSPDTPDQPIQ